MSRNNIDVEVTPAKDGGQAQAVIKDEVAKRAWSGEGKDESAATTEAMRKFLGDRRTREYTER